MHYRGSASQRRVPFEASVNLSTKGRQMNQDIRYTMLTDENFEREVLKHPDLVLVEFTKESYGSVHIIAPIVAKVLSDYSGKLKVGRLDIDAACATAAHYRIHEIPTLLFFRNGVVVEDLVGTFRRKELSVKLQALLGKAP
jgi:thioredoxin 1